MADPSDDLARTATAAAGAGGAAPALGASLGRYKLERMLGEGGMGVVHAAFDPDLERRVALKVLRTADGGDQARQRLLREARAMARLTHTNVVTVHEVGSAEGRDYVAMELVDGESLDQWLRAAKRLPAEIVDAFVAAGRGLAAAHAAGLVHRDFKPHNVLRRRDGRIAVTDFGLARGVEGQIALAQTIDLKAATPAVTPSALAELTATGSVLGTPAYMAPEQWAGGSVGPPADQFAFCVAAWEALTGERPFRGATLDALKAEVHRGPAELDASKLPRRLRAALRRGLDPEPARRWPSMDALLAAIGRATRRRPIALYIGAGAVLVAAGLFVGLGHRVTVVACTPPALDPAVVWPASEAAALHAAGRGEIADVLGRDVTAWTAARERACQAPTERGLATLACLDGTIARLDAVHRAVGKVSGELSPSAVVAQLVAPSACEVASPPRLVVKSTPEVVEALGFVLDASRDDTKLAVTEVRALADKQGLDPCARSLALSAAADRIDETDVPATRKARADAIAAAELCGDERMRADTLLADAPLQYEQPTIGPRGEAAIVKASTAVARVAQPDLVAEVDAMRAEVAAGDHRWPDAFALLDKAIGEFGQRRRAHAQLVAALRAIELHSARATISDLQAERTEVAKWKPVAEALHEDKLVRGFAFTDAFCRWFLGDTEGGQHAMMELWKPKPLEGVPSKHVDGVVVDAAGKPVPGATVITGQMIFVDEHGPIPLPGASYTMRIATTDAAGAFDIPDASATGAIVAQLGTTRSDPAALAPHTRLVLAPVRRISGTAELAGHERTNSFVMLEPRIASVPYRLIAPIGERGVFTVGSAPTAKVQLGIATRDGMDVGSIQMVGVPASPTDTTGVKLALTSSERVLDLIARSTTSQQLDAAEVFLLPGKVSVHNVADLNERAKSAGIKVQFARPVVGETAPPQVLRQLRTGDLVAHFTAVPAGELTACAVGMNGDLHDPKFATKIQAHVNELALQCEAVAADAIAVVVEAPPQKRFD